LGLNKGGKSLFRATGREKNEDPVFYVQRLKFMGDWSRYLKEHDVSAARQRDIERSFASAQVTFKKAHDELAELIAAVAFPDPLQGRAGAAAAKHRLEQYVPLDPLDKGGFYLQMYKVKHGVLDALSEGPAKRFEETVWPGVREFGFAAPMK
jgi:hypothetical protein